MLHNNIQTVIFDTARLKDIEHTCSQANLKTHYFKSYYYGL